VEEEQKRWTKDLDDFVNNAPRYNKTLAFIVDWFSRVETKTGYIARETAKFRGEMVAILKPQEAELELLKIENALLEGESIPNLELLVKHYKDRLASLMAIGPHEESEIDRLKEINSLTKERIEAVKRLTEALEYQRDIRISFAIPEFRIPEMKLPFEKIELLPEKPFKELPEDWEIAADEIEARLKQFQSMTMSYMNQISGAFASSMVGIKVEWESMIQSMIASLIQSALTSWIQKILFPTPLSGLGFFIPGLQYGTPYVPETGLYPLHRGEAVIPASQNISNVRNYGGAINNYYLMNLDVDKLTRKSIVPTIERLSRDRKTKILTA